MRGLEARTRAVLDRHLQPASPRPIAVALSGGGDSLALTLIADRWARDAGRPLLILTVDHRLQAAGADWSRTCAALAERLDRPFRSLTWDGEKPATGLPAAARSARHRLLADAARDAGARVILMGHTADDILEARRMRAAGATTPDPRTWAPSPVWPEGRGLFVLRPLLEAGRADLRGWLEARGERWIDDPANLDPRYARSRARAAPEATARPVPTSAPPPPGLWSEALGIVSLDRNGLRRAPPEASARLVAMACVCAGGGERRPAGAHLERLTARLHGPGTFVATLAGARVMADDSVVLIAREAGEAGRGGLCAIDLAAEPTTVWDGRFDLTCDRPGQTVRTLSGVAARLPVDQRRRLAGLPAGARGGLPALVDADGRVTSPVLAEIPGVTATSLVGARLAAATGAVEREPG